MRRYIRLVFLLLILIIIACKSSVSEKKDSTPRDRFEIIIDDYYENNNYDIKKHDVFAVDEKSTTGKNFFLYSILPLTEYNFYTMWQKDNNLPSDYINYRGKIFLLHEQEKNKFRRHSYREVLECLDSLNMLDSTQIKLDLGLLKSKDAVFRKTRFGSRVGVDFIICKDKPFRIRKRIKTSVYIKPTDEMFENICD